MFSRFYKKVYCFFYGHEFTNWIKCFSEGREYSTVHCKDCGKMLNVTDLVRGNLRK